ncbi:MAG: DUF5522 domain-containing protein [Planctomycetota bacterium]
MATTDAAAGGREPDYYLDNGCVVFTAAYHLRRGSCCGSGCRHCPYGNAPGDIGAPGQTVSEAAGHPLGSTPGSTSAGDPAEPSRG